ncbi:MAG TPA: lipopolysaccharide heptosyltransferase II [bacterium]|nr:lipopolysaccharide heptosyltransferase II [bacterium]
MRALIVQTAYLGDVVLAQPLWANLKAVRPDATIDALVQPQWASLLAGDAQLHQVISFDKRGAHRGLGGLRKMAEQLRAEKYDLALCPHPSLRSALLLWVAQIPRRIGFGDSAGAFFFTEKIVRDRTAHEIDRVLSLLTALDNSPPAPMREPRLHVSPEADERVVALLKEAGLHERKFVCAHPGSVWATKRWPAERFGETLSALARDGYRPVVLGGKDDIELANIVQDTCGELPLNLAGRLSLPELTALLARASLLLTNDSGPMHIAGAVNTPVVAIFGSTVPALGYAPVGSPAIVVEKSMPCRPCGPHGYRRCPLEHLHCLRHIDAAMAVEAARSLLA